jgi:hypothetical protein
VKIFLPRSEIAYESIAASFLRPNMLTNLDESMQTYVNWHLSAQQCDFPDVKNDAEQKRKNDSLCLPGGLFWVWESE